MWTFIYFHQSGDPYSLDEVAEDYYAGEGGACVHTCVFACTCVYTHAHKIVYQDFTLNS